MLANLSQVVGRGIQFLIQFMRHEIRWRRSDSLLHCAAVFIDNPSILQSRVKYQIREIKNRPRYDTAEAGNAEVRIFN